MKYIIANWKMNMDAQAISNWIDGATRPPSNGDKKILIAPSFLYIPLLQQFKDKLNIELCAQDASMFSKGSHTGEVGAFQIKNFCKYCIVGHSEREESYETVIKKRDICLQNGITPIVCFTNPSKASDFHTEGVILAWEDPDNISKNGQPNAKDIKDIEKGIQTIRKQIDEGCDLVYGGSVNRQNIQDLVNINKLNGILVGSASLDPNHFKELVDSF